MEVWVISLGLSSKFLSSIFPVRKKFAKQRHKAPDSYRKRMTNPGDQARSADQRLGVSWAISEIL